MFKLTKRFLALALALVLVFVLVSCGGGTSSKEGSEAESKDPVVSKEQAADGEGIVVGYISKNTVDAFHATINKAAKEALDGMVSDGTIESWNMYDGMTDPVTQVDLLEDAINMGVNVVILLPAESAGGVPILERCKEKNIPCIVVNSKTDNTDELAAAYVGSDDVQAGEMMAQFIEEQIPEGGGYGHIQGIIGNSAQIDRGVGMNNIFSKNDKWALLDGCEQTAEWQAEKAVKFAEDWLAKYGEDLNAIVCDNDDMSSAVQAAMNGAGREDIVCIGVDGNAGPITMVKDGELRATVYQDGAGQVTKAIELIPQVAAGETVEKEIMIDFVLVTADNAEQYLA